MVIFWSYYTTVETHVTFTSAPSYKLFSLRAIGFKSYFSTTCRYIFFQYVVQTGGTRTLIIRGDRGERFIARRKSWRLIVARSNRYSRGKFAGRERCVRRQEFRDKIKGRSRFSANELTSTCRPIVRLSVECRESYRIEPR